MQKILNLETSTLQKKKNLKSITLQNFKPNYTPSKDKDGNNKDQSRNNKEQKNKELIN